MTTAKGYTEMKDSGIQWIGQIPTHWLLKKAKYCVSITNGSDPKSEGSVPVYGSGSESFKTCGEYKEGPAVLIGRKGATLHIPHYIEGRYWNVDTAFDVKPQEDFSLRYYYYLACVFDYNYYISQTTLPGMTQTNYNNMKLPCPSLDEQTAIASYLDAQCAKIDEIIAQAKASMEDYKQWKASIIYEAVTKGLNPNVEMKDSGIEWIPLLPTAIKVSRVGLHFSIILGKMLCPKPLDDTYTLEPYFCAANVHFSGVDSENLKEMWFNPDEKERYRVAPGDLLVVEGGAGAGGCAVIETVDFPIYIQNSIMIVRSKRKNNVKYLKYFLETLVGRGYIDFACNKATIPHFTKEKLSAVPFPVFDCDTQARIVDFLDSKCGKIDDLIFQKQSLIDDLESYKKSLIYEVVTGKRRV